METSSETPVAHGGIHSTQCFFTVGHNHDHGKMSNVDGDLLLQQ